MTNKTLPQQPTNSGAAETLNTIQKAALAVVDVGVILACIWMLLSHLSVGPLSPAQWVAVVATSALIRVLYGQASVDSWLHKAIADAADRRAVEREASRG